MKLKTTMFTFRSHFSKKTSFGLLALFLGTYSQNLFATNSSSGWDSSEEGSEESFNINHVKKVKKYIIKKDNIQKDSTKKDTPPPPYESLFKKVLSGDNECKGVISNKILETVAFFTNKIKTFNQHTYLVTNLFGNKAARRSLNTATRSDRGYLEETAKMQQELIKKVLNDNYVVSQLEKENIKPECIEKYWNEIFKTTNCKEFIDLMAERDPFIKLSIFLAHHLFLSKNDVAIFAQNAGMKQDDFLTLANMCACEATKKDKTRNKHKTKFPIKIFNELKKTIKTAIDFSKYPPQDSPQVFFPPEDIDFLKKIAEKECVGEKNFKATKHGNEVLSDADFTALKELMLQTNSLRSLLHFLPSAAWKNQMIAQDTISACNRYLKFDDLESEKNEVSLKQLTDIVSRISSKYTLNKEIIPDRLLNNAIHVVLDSIEYITAQRIKESLPQNKIEQKREKKIEKKIAKVVKKKEEQLPDIAQNVAEKNEQEFPGVPSKKQKTRKLELEETKKQANNLTTECKNAMSLMLEFKKNIKSCPESIYKQNSKSIADAYKLLKEGQHNTIVEYHKSVKALWSNIEI